MKRPITLIILASGAAVSDALSPSRFTRNQRGVLKSTFVEKETVAEENEIKPKNKPSDYWRITSSIFHPQPRPLMPELTKAMEESTHPIESQEELGRGLSIDQDWRENWYTYESPADDPDLIDNETGYSEYECEVEGYLPDELHGTLYRNGPGKFGINGERVQHVLDADALVYKIEIPAVESLGKRKVKFLSRFVETHHFKEERKANRFLYRGTFGTTPYFEGLDTREKNGLNTDPSEASIVSRVVGGAFNTDIKNSANTQIISFGGKVLTLFEAGLPFRLDPATLETIGEDDLGGFLKASLPVKLGKGLEDIEPDFLGGSAHTAHPQICPDGNLVGWSWSQLPLSQTLEVKFTEWSEKNFDPLTSSTFEIPNCSLAPHDMAMTENSIVFMINALEMNTLPFLFNIKGPAASLSMDGRKNVKAWIFPRPSAKDQFEPFVVDVPACFSIHFSHGYEDEETGNLVTFFSGWPPSDSKDFLGAWGGFCPDFQQIPPTFLWRLEIDPKEKRTVSLDIAPGCQNICTEHMLVHPNFNTKKCENVYGTISNVIGDSTPPNGYVRLKVESGSKEKLRPGEPNEDADAYWFGTRYFTTEPIIVPKDGSDPEDEDAAFLLGMVRDAAKQKNFLSVFDLERDLKEGPIAKIWLKSGVPHGIHGCFSKDNNGGPSVFC